jgi:hypothetical protein
MMEARARRHDAGQGATRRASRKMLLPNPRHEHSMSDACRRVFLRDVAATLAAG